MNIDFTHTYSAALNEFVIESSPDKIDNPELVFFNSDLDESLNLNLGNNDSQALGDFFAGNSLTSKAHAQAYAGHQFGHYNPQLGDGRALIIGEHIDLSGHKHDLCLKGSGRTPFSRGGDGKAALGPMLREVLIAESMHALNIPTTRSLAVVKTNEDVYRQSMEPGAILCRTAASHIRIGTFQFVSNYAREEGVKKLADYAIARHYPQCSKTDKPYINFLNCVVNKQAELIAKWMSVGFIHGVMNTDNMCISGETIDYGPCAFMEAYHPETVFSSIDHQGRYAYQNQPAIAQWNLARLAETLLPLLSDDEQASIDIATQSVTDFGKQYKVSWHQAMRAKLGFHTEVDNQTMEREIALINRFLDIIQDNKADFTLSWLYIGNLLKNQAFEYGELIDNNENFKVWFTEYLAALNIADTIDQTNSSLQKAIKTMANANPVVIPRNHNVEQALTDAATLDNFDEFNNLYKVINQPFENSNAPSRYILPANTNFTQHFKTFCGT